MLLLENFIEIKKKIQLSFWLKRKKKILLIYDAINKILIKNKILAPKLIKSKL